MTDLNLRLNENEIELVEESQPRLSPGSSDAAQAPAKEAINGTQGMAPLDSSGGELRRGEGLCQGSSSWYFKCSGVRNPRCPHSADSQVADSS